MTELEESVVVVNKVTRATKRVLVSELEQFLRKHTLFQLPQADSPVVKSNRGKRKSILKSKASKGKSSTLMYALHASTL